MKKENLILSLVMLLCFTLHGQKKVAQEINQLKKDNTRFEKISLVSKLPNAANAESKKAVQIASYAHLDMSQLNNILQQRFSQIEIEIPYQSDVITVQLHRCDPLDKNFHADTHQQEKINYTPGVYYRGIIKDENNSIVSFNFFNREFNAIISSARWGNINVGKLLQQPDEQLYIIYSDDNLLVNADFSCHTSENKVSEVGPQNRLQNTTDVKTVTTYIEVGYQAYEANGFDINTTINWITSIFNNMQTLYANDGISISLKSIYVWTVDDYYKTSGNFIIPAFINIRPSFDGDVGFIADIDPQGLGGQAYGIGMLCQQGNYAYGDVYLDFNTVPNFSKSVNFMAHELGHVLGSHHTHTCVWNGNNTAIDGCATAYGGCPTLVNPPDFQGTIMSYCTPLLFMGFGEQPAQAIRDHINNAPCMSVNATENCINTIGAIQALNVTQTSATIEWSDSNANNNEWAFSMVPYGSTPLFTSTTSTSHLFENLSPNTYYEVIVKGNCIGDLTYPLHSRVFATQGDNCNGIQISDTGGPSSAPQPEEHIIRTIIPTVPDKKIKLTFGNVNLSPYNSFLFVYDGLDTNGPLINKLYGGYPFLGIAHDNVGIPHNIQSSDPSGALTLEYISRQGSLETTTFSGWNATISCLNVLGNEAYGDGYTDYSYSPNPVKGFLDIKSKDFIKKVKIYTVDGKLLSTQNADAREIHIDFSNYQKGNYIIHLDYEKTTSSFKIIKE